MNRCATINQKVLFGVTLATSLSCLMLSIIFFFHGSTGTANSLARASLVTLLLSAVLYKQVRRSDQTALN